MRHWQFHQSLGPHRSWSVLCVAAAILLAAVPAQAQEYEYRGEVFGLAGYGKTYDDEGSLGAGGNFAGGFGYRISPRFGAEFEVNGFRHEREFGGQQAAIKGSGIFAVGNAVYYVTRGRTQLYLLGGAGLLNYKSIRTYNPDFSGDRGSGFALDFGAGLKIFLNKHFSLRPDFRIFAGGAGDKRLVEPPFGDVRISIGAGYHW